jgi:hypothetical protein
MALRLCRRNDMANRQQSNREKKKLKTRQEQKEGCSADLTVRVGAEPGRCGVWLYWKEDTMSPPSFRR